MPTPTTAYRNLIQADPAAYPLFHQDWWLDMACGGSAHWRGIVSEQAYKGARALMPVPLLPKWRVLPTVRRPLLTPYLGPWAANLPKQNHSTHFHLAHKLWPQLISQLPRVLYFHQTCRPELVQALPFHTAGYQLQARYSYRLQPGEINFNRNNRRALSRATELQIWPAHDTRVLFNLLHSSLRRQGLSVPFAAPLMESLHRAAAERQQSQVWVAGPHTEEPQAAIWVLWDAFCIYVLSNGVSQAGRQSGAYPKLIKHLLANPPVPHLPIDLCGTMLPAVARVNEGLGAQARLTIELRKGWLT